MIEVKDGVWGQSTSVVASPLDDGIALLNTSDNVYYSLDGIAPLLWNAMFDGCTHSRLCELVKEEYALSSDEIERDISEWLAEMAEAGLVVERN